ncbi:MAG: hypothetical protein E7262_06125 [Lachnospiraceae bacterium]|nr:hypothetical protein [Lachnospiraceae bacterium]
MTGGKHCYPGTDVLINRYGIKDKDKLEKLEIQKIVTKLLGLDTRWTRIKCTYDLEHLISIHKYLFGDIYDFAGTFRKENLFKSERVLSGGSADYCDYKYIKDELKILFKKYNSYEWEKNDDNERVVTEFLLDLWSIHPFREGNTRTCITFLWHYLKGKKINLKVELLRNNPMYVRDALVMANYEEKSYLQKIISDALKEKDIDVKYVTCDDNLKEQYHIAKGDYEAFKNKYSIKKEK